MPPLPSNRANGSRCGGVLKDRTEAAAAHNPCAGRMHTDAVTNIVKAKKFRESTKAARSRPRRILVRPGLGGNAFFHDGKHRYARRFVQRPASPRVFEHCMHSVRAARVTTRVVTSIAMTA